MNTSNSIFQSLISAMESKSTRNTHKRPLSEYPLPALIFRLDEEYDELLESYNLLQDCLKTDSSSETIQPHLDHISSEIADCAILLSTILELCSYHPSAFQAHERNACIITRSHQ